MTALARFTHIRLACCRACGRALLNDADRRQCRCGRWAPLVSQTPERDGGLMIAPDKAHPDAYTAVLWRFNDGSRDLTELVRPVCVLCDAVLRAVRGPRGAPRHPDQPPRRRARALRPRPGIARMTPSLIATAPLAETFQTVVLRGGPAGDGRLFAVRTTAATVCVQRDPVRPTILIRVLDPATRPADALDYRPSGKTRSDHTPIWTPNGRWPV